ncbi:hypothetical protein [Fusobacterium periodonticum]|uniref:Metallopeptidase domain-containing protein n=1 Tax=Fusobacterium periodonticum ATCC 33693 TaxID=546275 RepID=D4CXK5_9FUSO|nr:hypothetical protein [Fusobacterium periodonticum]EFE86125.1 hypothetical protein FUSPEROL_02166 [Fusobacterium periodonticum ATCC 33693]
MIVKIAEQNFEFDLSKGIGQRELLDKLFLAYRNKFPFFINLLISICEIKNVEQEHKFALAYTKLNIDSERIDIFLNFEKMEKKKFTAEEFLYLIFHELLHNYFYHFQRFEEFDKDGYHELSNIVQDYYVNAYCNELIGKHVYEKLKNKKIDGINYDSISELCNFNNISGLPKEEELRQQWTDIKLIKFLINNGTKKNSPSNDNCKDKNGNNKNNNTENEENLKIDEHSLCKVSEPKNEKNKNLSENSIKEIFKNKIEVLENELKSQNYSTAESELFERKANSIKPDYFLNILKLKRIITKALGKNTEKSYKKLHRKKQGSEIVFKGNLKTNGYKLIIGIDVSGSISEQDLNLFINMLYGLNKKKKDYLFDIIYWSNNDIKQNKTYFEDVNDIKEFAKKKVYSTGGTDVTEFHKYLNERYKEPIEVINITDGYFYYDKNLNSNIQKYHFVLTEQLSESFKNFYSGNTFDIINIKQEKN